MQQRKKTYQARCNEEEAKIIDARIAKSGMLPSTFIRNALMNCSITPLQNRQDIMRALCSILSILNLMEPSNEVSQIKEEVQRICQYLK